VIGAIAPIAVLLLVMVWLLIWETFKRK
jgi:hypothetical protein